MITLLAIVAAFFIAGCCLEIEEKFRQADVLIARGREVPDDMGEHFAACPEPIDWLAREREVQS